MEIWYYLIIVFLLTYEPIYGYFDYQHFKHRVRLNPEERVRYYKKVMIGLWAPTILILSLVLVGPLTFEDIGVKGVQLHTETLGPWVTYITLGLVGAYILGLSYYLIAAKVSPKMKAQIIKMKQQELVKSQFSDIMPVSKQDKQVWTYVSWTAGITEEIIYRGFLIFALIQLFPDMSVWMILLLSSLLFGLAHTYQGLSNVIKTGLMGMFFALLYISLDSLFPVILLHALMDYVAKIGDEEVTVE
ncbi:membrane protease YdiL (CAAX protease family) [Bacillus mesophilus]|uniref:CPBP family intramembrane metalloprotease n=1 Tax=Bacillus mesophilus TaxID=1808955 RepID=A0A6M0Q3L5_9BACI|nr:CPBP family intramembrane glutamic endopeptidase [Bacillus mesophilus]MBM7660271.1 membrane protease YdiL (CAAX protease family) [Bacillus mesophilus]NEY70986.1 CPBP family intramembrane metalloprotease [Bacillus mesophilus]